MKKIKYCIPKLRGCLTSALSCNDGSSTGACSPGSSASSNVMDFGECSDGSNTSSVQTNSCTTGTHVAQSGACCSGNAATSNPGSCYSGNAVINAMDGTKGTCVAGGDPAAGGPSGCQTGNNAISF